MIFWTKALSSVRAALLAIPILCLALPAFAQENEDSFDLTWACTTKINSKFSVTRKLREDGAFQSQGESAFRPMEGPSRYTGYERVDWQYSASSAQKLVPMLNMRLNVSYDGPNSYLEINAVEGTPAKAVKISPRNRLSEYDFLIDLQSLTQAFPDARLLNAQLYTLDQNMRYHGGSIVQIDVGQWREFLPRFEEANSMLDAMQSDYLHKCSGGAALANQAAQQGLLDPIIDGGYSQCRVSIETPLARTDANTGLVSADAKIMSGWEMSFRMRPQMATDDPVAHAKRLDRFSKQGFLGDTLDMIMETALHGESSYKIAKDEYGTYRLILAKGDKSLVLYPYQGIDWKAVKEIEAVSGRLILSLRTAEGRIVKKRQVADNYFSQIEAQMQTAYQEVLRKRTNPRRNCETEPEEIII